MGYVLNGYKPAGMFGIDTSRLNQSGNQAMGQIGTALLNQPAQMAGTLGGMFGGYGQNMQQGLAGGYGAMAGAVGNAYGAYAQGLGNLANAQANERSNMYGAAGMAEAARQGALGNIGSAALGAYGSAANSALASYAQQQQAYQQAMSQLAASNQNALSGYGQSRNTALGQLANAYPQVANSFGAVGKGAMAADMAGKIMGGGESFQATGPEGEIASGSYTPAADGGGYGGNATMDRVLPYMEAAYGGLDSTRRDLMSPDMPAHMMSGYADSANRMTDAHRRSEGMPRNMLGDVLGGLTSMGRDAYGSSSAGMNQFYGAAQPTDYSPYLRDMASGYGDASRNIGGGYSDMANRMENNLNPAFAGTTQNVLGLYGDALAPIFDTAQRQMELDQRMRVRQARPRSAGADFGRYGWQSYYEPFAATQGRRK